MPQEWLSTTQFPSSIRTVGDCSVCCCCCVGGCYVGGCYVGGCYVGCFSTFIITIITDSPFNGWDCISSKTKVIPHANQGCRFAIGEQNVFISNGHTCSVRVIGNRGARTNPRHVSEGQSRNAFTNLPPLTLLEYMDFCRSTPTILIMVCTRYGKPIPSMIDRDIRPHKLRGGRSCDGKSNCVGSDVRHIKTPCLHRSSIFNAVYSSGGCTPD
mmetsp:Transcript_4059/g.6952  ORF Transcript_4059/g.6952 Transcript_4059/m.6952 type:complete len:213 (-) Transcript_4059:458-1096(-)